MKDFDIDKAIARLHEDYEKIRREIGMADPDAVLPWLRRSIEREFLAAVLAGRETMAAEMIATAGSTFGAVSPRHRPKVRYEADCVGSVISIERLRDIVSDVADRAKKARKPSL